jgi:drug/metabolite transporter (DMT)-like permease
MCVCIFWGMTYLAIRMALESVPPAFLLFLRFTTSGSLMLIGAVLTGAHLPRGRELWLTAGCGLAALGIGNGCLVFAEQWVPSGLASLFVTTSPFWLVGVEALAPGGEPLHGPSIKGMLVGVAGLALLVTPAASDLRANRNLLGGFFLLQLGCAGWAAGSIAQRKQTSRAHSFVSGAVQQLATGLAYAIPAALHPQPVHWTARSIGALAYLVTFGSIIGYSAYVFAMDRLPVALTSMYTYINPVVAVFVGWLVYREPFGFREAVAVAVIFAGVAIVKRVSVPVEKLGAEQAADGGQ